MLAYVREEEFYFKAFKNGDENAVGVYIVKSIEEKEEIKDGQELGE